MGGELTGVVEKLIEVSPTVWATMVRACERDGAIGLILALLALIGGVVSGIACYRGGQAYIARTKEELRVWQEAHQEAEPPAYSSLYLRMSEPPPFTVVCGFASVILLVVALLWGVGSVRDYYNPEGCAIRQIRQ